ncbi:MAG: AMP-binding protein [Proteobacteria bacterium]|nr:AMP-binding protein [Pseudomonadota bacterium]
MSKTVFWRGYHSPEILSLIRETWENDDLLILCPPSLNDVDYLAAFLPSGEATFCGDWNNDKKPLTCSYSQGYPKPPVLGVFTTGTTSTRPRLVLYSKYNIITSVKAIYNLFDISNNATIFCYPQPYHVFGLTLGYAASIIKNLKIICPKGKYNSEHHTTWSNVQGDTRRSMISLGTPTHFSDLIGFVEKNNVSFAPSYASIMGGALVNKDLWYKTKEKLLIEKPSIGYGCTEASPGVSHLPPGVAPLEDGELGFPLKGIKLEHTENGLEFRGKNLCLAIIDNKEISFPKSFLIPDKVEVRKDGALLYRGRADLVLNRGGVKHSLEQIEALIRDSLHIDVVCVSAPESRLGEELGIIVNKKESIQLGSEIFSLLENKTGCRFNKNNLLLVDAFPLNSNSKIDRNACQKLLAEHKANSFFPIDVEKLRTALPHRPPMVWINKVLCAEKGSGTSLVVLDKTAHYYSTSKLRRTSFIEWMAQAYGFNTAAYELYKSEGPTKTPSKAFLAAISNVKFNLENFDSYHAEKLFVHTKLEAQLDNLSLVKAQVTLEDPSVVLASATLKLYTEYS